MDLNRVYFSQKKEMKFSKEKLKEIYKELNKLGKRIDNSQIDGVDRKLIEETLWKCLFDKYLESHEMSTIDKIEYWAK